ncbi:MAG: methylated-DNA--[protein]-cysteine S-methyltransferase [bacterium]|nr:methylated-DNA--[protein]-cysteine S-methyltransferase [bacterium]
MNRKSFYSPLKTAYGEFIVLHNEKTIFGIAFPKKTRAGRKLKISSFSSKIEKSFNEYFSARKPIPDYYDTRVCGTEFELKVINAVRKVPFGKTRSYSEIAALIGRPKSQRAVASACRKNPVPIIIPCHRIVPGKGGSGGYSAGKKWKKLLLEIEKAGC